MHPLLGAPILPGQTDASSAGPALATPFPLYRFHPSSNAYDVYSRYEWDNLAELGVVILGDGNAD